MEKVIIDNETLRRTIRRLSYEIIEKNKNIENVCLVGIKSKGVELSKLIQQNIKQIEGVELPRGDIDITPYRDDMESDIDKAIQSGMNDHIGKPFLPEEMYLKLAKWVK